MNVKGEKTSPSSSYTHTRRGEGQTNHHQKGQADDPSHSLHCIASSFLWIEWVWLGESRGEVEKGAIQYNSAPILIYKSWTSCYVQREGAAFHFIWEVSGSWMELELADSHLTVHSLLRGLVLLSNQRECSESLSNLLFSQKSRRLRCILGGPTVDFGLSFDCSVLLESSRVHFHLKTEKDHK